MVRMAKLQLMIALALVSFHPGTAFSSDKKGSYMIYGGGTISCGKWIEIRKSPYDGGAAQWLAGYITSFNLYSYWDEDVANGTDINGLLAWVDNYCRENPLDNLAKASESLITKLVSKNIPSAEKPAN